MKKPSIRAALSRFIEGLAFAAGILAVAGIAIAFTTWAPGTPPEAAPGAGNVQFGIIPSGAVMAFDLASCPSGWSEYTSARDRVIIGSGSSYSRGATGGETTHTLTTAEMPSHNHAAAMMIPGGAPGVGDGSQGWPLYQRNQGQWTTYAGDGAAHNNMQPYIAILYCKKN